MRLKSIHFLAKSNLKGNKNSNTICALISLFVVAMTVISCFTATTQNAMNRYKEDYKARDIYISPWLSGITEEAKKAITDMEHVETVADTVGLGGNFTYEIVSIDDEDIFEKAQEKGNFLTVYGLYDGEEKSIIQGKSLDESPVYSCLVPSRFYPFSDVFEKSYKNLEYIDGRTLIGKNITVKGTNGNIDLLYNVFGADGCNDQSRRFLPSPEYTLKIVGTYPCSYSNSGSYASLYVSRETDLLMAEEAFEKAGINLSSETDSLAVWWNTPSLHEYFVIVDEYDNYPQVVNAIRELGIDASGTPDKEPDDTMVLMSTLFKTVGTFLTAAMGLIAAVLLVQSSVWSLKERKAAIGLMKAVGYTNGQIAVNFGWEQIYISLKGFAAGGAVSVLTVFFANLKFSHGTYQQLEYIINWQDFGIFLGVSFLVVLIIPLITQLILLRKIIKIQPREAMT